MPSRDGSFDVPSFPAQEAHIVLYLQHLNQSVQSKSAIEEAVNALSWLHQVSGLPPVSGLPLVQAALAGHRRLLAQPNVRKAGDSGNPEGDSGGCRTRTILVGGQVASYLFVEVCGFYEV